MAQYSEKVTGEVIRRRRGELGMSQVQLADAASVHVRQIRRYEAGDQQPLLSVGVAIARALKLSVLELVGEGSSHRVKLDGEWWMGWQTSNEDRPQVTAQTVLLTQQDELIGMQTTSRGSVDNSDGTRIPLTVESGGYHWSGELRIWDNKILMGWYAANDGSVNSKGSLFFVLQTHGDEASGMWTGMSHDGDLLSGWGAFGKSEDEVIDIVRDLKTTRGVKALRTATEIEGDHSDE